MLCPYIPKIPSVLEATRLPSVNIAIITAAGAPERPSGGRAEAGGSPLVGPLFGGVVRSDDLRLRHHSVLVLREGVAI